MPATEHVLPFCPPPPSPNPEKDHDFSFCQWKEQLKRTLYQEEEEPQGGPSHLLLYTYTTPFNVPHLFDVGQLVIVVKEEGQVLVGDVHSRVATVFLMLFLCVTASGKGIFRDLQIWKRLLPTYMYSTISVHCYSGHHSIRTALK